VTKYYRALGRLIAIRKNGTLYWIGSDHLGGTVRVADSGFAPVNHMRYTPYGVSRDDASALPLDYLFTDQQLDGSIGLYWYGSRAYDAAMGRFVCADTIVPSPGNPQSLNRFSYTYNNPLAYVDPSGHDAGMPLSYVPGVGDVEYYDYGGTRVKVVGMATSKSVSALGAGGLATRPKIESLIDQGSTVTVGRALVISPSDINNPVSSDLLKHELAHTKQAQRYDSDRDWLIAYAFVYKMTELMYGTDQAYRMDSFEREANLAVGLPEFWHSPSQSDPSAPAATPTPSPTMPLPSARNSNSLGQSDITPPIPAPAWGALGIYSIQTVAISDTGQLTGSIPSGLAPGGVGITGITASNPSGQPEDGRGWDCQNRAAREAAWIRGGCWGRNDDGTLFRGTP
jgi:RHS repeat-associated protein